MRGRKVNLSICIKRVGVLANIAALIDDVQFLMSAWYANRQTIHWYVDRLPVCVASCGGSGNDTSTVTQPSDAIAVAMVSSVPLALYAQMAA
jgi:hypothetical protein